MNLEQTKRKEDSTRHQMSEAFNQPQDNAIMMMIVNKAKQFQGYCIICYCPIGKK